MEGRGGRAWKAGRLGRLGRLGRERERGLGRLEGNKQEEEEEFWTG